MDVTSFGINHDTLLRGIYVSRTDKVGSDGVVTTFDLRMKEPNREPVMDTSVMHTFEHLMAVFLRMHKVWADKTIYVGPMGCRTGMYLIFKGDLVPGDILDIITEAFQFISSFDKEIPATKAKECGNHLDHNLMITKWESNKFLKEVLLRIKPENIEYPRQDEKPDFSSIQKA